MDRAMTVDPRVEAAAKALNRARNALVAGRSALVCREPLSDQLRDEMTRAIAATEDGVAALAAADAVEGDRLPDVPTYFVTASTRNQEGSGGWASGGVEPSREDRQPRIGEARISAGRESRLEARIVELTAALREAISWSYGEDVTPERRDEIETLAAAGEGETDDR